MKDVINKIGATMMVAGAGRQAPGANGMGHLYAGTAKVDITPPVGTAMCGYAEGVASEGIHDPLFARVLVLTDGSLSLAIVATDLVWLYSEKVVEEAKKQWGLDFVVLGGSHTHAGPHNHPTAWYSEMENKVIAAIGEAKTNLFPARIGAGMGPVESQYFGYNRRVVDENGKVRMLWTNPDRKPVGPTDPTMRVIRVDDDSGKTRALLTHYACHPVTLGGSNRQTSADFPGAMTASLEQELGNDAIAMFLQGGGGDVHPYEAVLPGNDYGFDRVSRSGISLGKDALRVAKGIKLQHSEDGVSIKVKESVLHTTYRAKEDKVVEVGVMAVVIGDDIALAVVSGEPYVQHQLDLVAKSPLKNTFLLGYTYFGKGIPLAAYLPTLQATKEGGHGAVLGNAHFLEGGSGERMIDEAVKSIQELIAMPIVGQHPRAK